MLKINKKSGRHEMNITKLARVNQRHQHKPAAQTKSHLECRETNIKLKIVMFGRRQSHDTNREVPLLKPTYKLFQGEIYFHEVRYRSLWMSCINHAQQHRSSATGAHNTQKRRTATNIRLTLKPYSYENNHNKHRSTTMNQQRRAQSGEQARNYKRASEQSIVLRYRIAIL